MFTNSLVQQNFWQKMHRTIKIQRGAFFPLVKQQQITKTTSILWNTQSWSKGPCEANPSIGYNLVKPIVEGSINITTCSEKLFLFVRVIPTWWVSTDKKRG